MTIDNAQDVIDSREVIERLAELNSSEGEITDDEREELEVLAELNVEGEDASADWADGETLIRDSYFTEYAQEFAEDIGAVNARAEWPNNCIDWEQAARELRMDYTPIDFNGVRYWV